MIRGLWDSESLGIAVADATPAGDGEQQCSFDYEAASGIAISTKAGTSAYVDLEKFAEGQQAAVEALREVLTNGLIEKFRS